MRRQQQPCGSTLQASAKQLLCNCSFPFDWNEYPNGHMCLNFFSLSYYWEKKMQMKKMNFIAINIAILIPKVLIVVLNLKNTILLVTSKSVRGPSATKGSAHSYFLRVSWSHPARDRTALREPPLEEASNSELICQISAENSSGVEASRL